MNGIRDSILKHCVIVVVIVVYERYDIVRNCRLPKNGLLSRLSWSLCSPLAAWMVEPGSVSTWSAELVSRAQLGPTAHAHRLAFFHVLLSKESGTADHLLLDRVLEADFCQVVLEGW